ncbi:hypothetical protein B0H14DRAFT_3598883 [Mycena olivaceomarginata]|nr:hypothetical protein B0H14DRAFT_3598883 [Mycena olivaceomarginata]
MPTLMELDQRYYGTGWELVSLLSVVHKGPCPSPDCAWLLPRIEVDTAITNICNLCTRMIQQKLISCLDPSSEADSDAPKRKPKPNRPSQPRKRSSTSGKGKARATDDDSDPENGIRVTAKSEKRRTGGMFVHRGIYLDSVPESWDVPASDNRIAYIVDLTETPDLLGVGRKLLTVDGYIKKECQDSLASPTGSTAEWSLARVVILDIGKVVLCRRSNLKCGGCYTCVLAADDFLDNCERWDNTEEQNSPISTHIMAAKASESTSVAAVASAFYRSIVGAYCKGMYLDSDTPCGGQAILRKFREGEKNDKTYFVGCSNWEDGDSDQMSKTHRFTAIPSAAREPILVRLFKGEPIDAEDNDMEVLAGSCSQIIHPLHLPKNSVCRYPHNHPSFVRTKAPAVVQQKYKQCVVAEGSIGATGLRVDKAPSTREILGGQLPQEIHPSMINGRRRREIVWADRKAKFPQGTGLPGVYHEFNQEQTCNIAERYIHSVTTQADDTHVIITIHPELAKLALNALWIMVDTTFAVVHGKTNEWKLVIWLNSIDKRTVIGRVWSNRATRTAFVLVWNGIFQAIKTITGHTLNFKAFSPKSKLLGAIGDSEGAQAQVLGDMVILRHMNSMNGAVHFKCGVFTLKPYITENDLAYLLGFSHLLSSEEIEQYYMFCENSPTKQVQDWWAHKQSYPWLLPSLNCELSHFDKHHWDLTPSDSNPIEGSHAQDNQVNSTNQTLLEAILLQEQFTDHKFWAKKLDCDTAQVILATLQSGVLENRNNSLQARFRSKSQRDARSREKRNKAQALTGKEATRLRGQVNAGKQQLKEKEKEIAAFRHQLQIRNQSVAGPSKPSKFTQGYESPITIFDDVDLDHSASGPSSGPSRLAALNLFPTLRPMTLIAVPRSDFDYMAALNSGTMDRTFKAIAQDYQMHPVDSDEEVLASDPYPIPYP